MNFMACNINPWQGTPQKRLLPGYRPRTNKKLPSDGTRTPPEYIETVREEFPSLPLAAITTYWKYGAIASEIRNDLEKGMQK